MNREDWEIVQAIFGFVAFIALMMLFPICIRLGHIRDLLRRQQEPSTPARQGPATLEIGARGPVK